jgi:hypothetical protein
MSEPAARRLRRADTFLSRQSWDKTWEMMDALMQRAALLGALRESQSPLLLELADAQLEVG